ncbi:hypothetical protein HYU45_00615 [Candidatus Daviesbacteria bacterium]|nr:hypothetical protein [Candidatus Daviesbacteria bacterium]
MNQKLVAGVLGLLVLGFVGYFISANIANKQNFSTDKQPKVVGADFDFGDAPDGSQGQNFPSLLSSNGARTKKTDEVWLGQAVTVERDSKQVDKDENDDGVKLVGPSCKQSSAYFFVHIKNPGKMTGTAYLNLYADWNKDGRWGGQDECGTEWAVQNFAVDVSKQTEEIALYQVLFTAGKNTREIWFRGAVTLDQQMNETATGEFLSGEIEDWNLTETPKDYFSYCDPNPLVLNHGDEKTVTIKADPLSQKIKSVALSTLVKPDNDRRKITQNGNSFTYKSKKVDGPRRDEPDSIPYSVEFTDGVGWWDWCPVIVHHDEPPTTIKRPLPIPSKAPSIETKSGGSTKTETHPIQEGIPAQP